MKKTMTAVLLSVAVAGQTCPAYPVFAGEMEANKLEEIVTGEPTKAAEQTNPGGQIPGEEGGQTETAELQGGGNTEIEQEKETERRAEEERLAAENEQNTSGNPVTPTVIEPTPEPKQQPPEEPDEIPQFMSPARDSDIQEQAEEVVEGDGYSFNVVDGTLTITDGSGFSNYSQKVNKADICKVVISENITLIANQAFENCGNLTSVECPTQIKEIGKNAFRGCGNLVSVGTLAEIIQVQDYAFMNCVKLESVDFVSVMKIGKSAFENCQSLISAGSLEKVTDLGQSAFRDCGRLMSVDLAAVTEIRYRTFQGCGSLTDVGSLEKVTVISENAFRDCSKLTSVNFAAVTVIEKSAFEDCYNLANVGSLEKVTQIGVSAFRSCGKLTSVKLSSVTTIGNRAFQNCGSLTSVELPISLQTIGDYGFYECSQLNRIYLPEDATVNNKGISDNTCQVRYTVSGEGDGRKATITEIQKGGNTFTIPEMICGIPVVKVTATYNGTLTHEGREHITDTDTWSYDASYHWKKCDLCWKEIKKAKHSGGSPNADGQAICAVCGVSYQKAVQETPKISIDYEKEELNTTTAMEYSVDGGETWKDCSETMKVSDSGIGWDGTAEKKIKIRMKKTDSSLESAIVDVVIPARPVLNIEPGSIAQRHIRVKVIGAPMDSKIELSHDKGVNWIAAIRAGTDGYGFFYDLKAGKEYTIWVKCSAVASKANGTEGSFASEISATMRTWDPNYTISIPSKLKVGDDGIICVDEDEIFAIGAGGRVNVSIEENTNGYSGNVKLERENANNTVISVLKVDGEKVNDGQIASFEEDSEKVTIHADAPQPTEGTVIPAGQYKGTVTFQITYEQ